MQEHPQPDLSQKQHRGEVAVGCATPSFPGTHARLYGRERPQNTQRLRCQWLQSADLTKPPPALCRGVPRRQAAAPPSPSQHSAALGTSLSFHITTHDPRNGYSGVFQAAS